MAPLIDVRQLTKVYGETIGVEKLTFSVEVGQVFGFLGPNGAGKTTTIRLLLDLLRPTQGQITLFQLPLADHSLQIRSRCGYLPGNFAGYANMRATEFLDFISRLRKPVDNSRKALIERFHLSTADLGKKIKHLSHGTRQKLGIIQAFFHWPQLIILDEPTTGLDPLMQEEFYHLVRETRHQGSTIFFSSHNLPEVEKICDRVAIVRHGELVAFEKLETLKKKRYRRLRVRLQERIEPLEITGAELLSHQEGCYEFLVRGDIHSVLKSLSALPVEDVVFPEPDLEEVFLAYYQPEYRD